MLIPGGEEGSVFEERMLLNNSIPGLLPVEIILENGEKEYRYDVTGCTSMSVLTQLERLSGEMLKGLYTAISRLVAEVRRYLLREEGLMLSPELIWRNSVTGEWMFCFHSGTATDLREQIRALSAWIINHIDVSDPSGVYIGYSIYLLSLEEETGLSDIEGVFLRPEYLETERQGQEGAMKMRELTPGREESVPGMMPEKKQEFQRVGSTAEEGEIIGDVYEEQALDDTEALRGGKKIILNHSVRRLMGEAVVLFVIVGILMYMIP